MQNNMEYSLLVREHEIEFKWKKIKFNSPILYDFMKFTEVLGKWDVELYPSAIKTIVTIDESDIIIASYAKEITEKIIDQIYPKKDDEWVKSGQSNSFFPANIDYISSSYWMHPVDFLKNTTVNQMEAIWAAKERNWNIRNWDEHKNKWILTRQLGKKFEKDAKDRIREKFWSKMSNNS